MILRKHYGSTVSASCMWYTGPFQNFQYCCDSGRGSIIGIEFVRDLRCGNVIVVPGQNSSLFSRHVRMQKEKLGLFCYVFRTCSDELRQVPASKLRFH